MREREPSERVSFDVSEVSYWNCWLGGDAQRSSTVNTEDRQASQPAFIIPREITRLDSMMHRAEGQKKRIGD
jgi:hypothetical protein